MTVGIGKRIWLEQLLHELRIDTAYLVKVFCDNQSTNNIVKNHGWTKNTEIDRYFLKEKIENETINLLHTPTSQQITDILTKALPRQSFEDLSPNFGFINIYI